MTRKKTGPKLRNGQRELLLTWIAAEYDTGLILHWAREKADNPFNPWPVINNKLVQYYRTSRRWTGEIERLRRERRESAINSGLALKEERIARLCRHADELEAIKWVPDERGRMWHEKAWRETLADIAAEMGHRKQTIDVNLVLSEARRIAAELGLDPAAVVAEAERIVGVGTSS